MKPEEDPAAGLAVAAAAPFSPQDINRLRWHCRRGMLELDLILARFLDQHLAQLSAQQLREFEALLALEDQVLWRRIGGAASAGSELERMLHRCAG